jgi:hypothetical protein
LGRAHGRNASSTGLIGLRCACLKSRGLGITNTKIMNVALMVKWIWRLSLDSSLWHQIIRAKYPGAGDIFNSTANGGSPFWHSIHKIKDFLSLGLRFDLGNGERFRFWTDLWTGDFPL